MENNLITKQFENSNVEIILDENGNPLFELYSTGMSLGQVVKNGKGVLYPNKSRIDKNIENAEIKPCLRNANKYLNEEMLYDFMLECKTDKCKPFRKWVTSEVLPSIRKNGVYSSNNQLYNIQTQQINLLMTNFQQMALGMAELTKVMGDGLESVKQETMEVIQDSIKSKDNQIDEIIEENTKTQLNLNRAIDNITLSSRNTRNLSECLKEKLSDLTGDKVMATDDIYIKNKFKLFRKYKVNRWEQIPTIKINNVYADIQALSNDEVGYYN